MDKSAPPSPRRSGGAVLRGLMDFRLSPGLERTADVGEAVAQGLAFANVYTFASVDYPGAAHSEVWDSNGTTAVGVFVFDPRNTLGSGPSPATAFTFSGGVYQILTVPSSTESIAMGINAAGLVVGVYVDLAGVRRGFVNDAGGFSDVDHSGAVETQVYGVNDAGNIVGSYFDTSGEHGFVRSGGTFTPINFPGAPVTIPIGINTAGDIVGAFLDGTSFKTRGFLLQAGGGFTAIDFPFASSTRAFGISNAGEIAGSYVDTAGNGHGYLYAGGAFSTVDVAGARNTQVTRINNEGLVTGFYLDALNEFHGLTGQ
jgi:uncharacterized membrane protein